MNSFVEDATQRNESNKQKRRTMVHLVLLKIDQNYDSQQPYTNHSYQSVILLVVVHDELRRPPRPFPPCVWAFLLLTQTTMIKYATQESIWRRRIMKKSVLSPDFERRNHSHCYYCSRIFQHGSYSSVSVSSSSWAGCI